MKKNIVLIAALAIGFVLNTTSCVSKNKVKEETSLESSKMVDEIPSTVTTQPTDTVTTSVVPIPTGTENKEERISDDNYIPEYAKDYPTVVINVNTIPVVLYASDNWEGPSDSVLALSGIVVKQEDKKIVFMMDSTVIPQDISISYNKGKTLVTQYGKVTEYVAKRVSIDNGKIFIDNKLVSIKPISMDTLRIGVPYYNPIIFNGKNSSLFSSEVPLGDVSITTDGKSTISLTKVHDINNINIKGMSNVTIGKINRVDSLQVSDAAQVILQNCDSIYIVTVTGKGKLQLPEKTPITKQKISGSAEIIKQ